MLKEQTELFQTMNTIEADKRIKRLKGKVNKEVISACQYFLHGKSEHLCLNCIEIVNKRSGRPVKFCSTIGMRSKAWRYVDVTSSCGRVELQ